MWNALAARTPALVVQPVSARDVAVAVGFARDHGLLLSVKGGGHNIAGTSLADRGLTLDLARMRDVTVDAAARLVHVGPGCLLQDVDRATQRHGLATVLGFISEVGVAGLTLGGGFGYLMRRFGWAVDNLHEVQIVTADGAIRTANREINAELFWALLVEPNTRGERLTRDAVPSLMVTASGAINPTDPASLRFPLELVTDGLDRDARARLYPALGHAAG